MKIRTSTSFAQFRGGLRPKHGPQSWPWWRLFGVSVVRLEVVAPTTGYRLWLYTRWGAAYGDLVFDRRTVVA